MTGIETSAVLQKWVALSITGRTRQTLTSTFFTYDPVEIQYLKEQDMQTLSGVSGHAYFGCDLSTVGRCISVACSRPREHQTTFGRSFSPKPSSQK